jgi:hypothetical protein
MRKLIFIIVLFFSTSVLAEGTWEEIPTNLTELLKKKFAIIDQYSVKNSRHYLLYSRQKLIVCRVYNDLQPKSTKCFIERVVEKQPENFEDLFGIPN